MVVSGAPERRENHGDMICTMAMDMMHAITYLKDPSTNDTLEAPETLAAEGASHSKNSLEGKQKKKKIVLKF